VGISNENGEVGKRFIFSAEEFTKMVGYDDWLGQKFDIVLSGSQSLVIVVVWKDGNTFVGEKSGYKAASAGDWKVNDTFQLNGCSNPDNPCKDVTFGECDLNNSNSKVISINTQQSVQLCNEDCYDTSNCTTYRYNNKTKECTLITGEYRASCNIMAGPMDKKAIYCLDQIRNPICDSHVEEDCEYNGELLLETDEGGAGQFDDCLKTCEDVFGPECKYMIHNKSTSSCILKGDGRKTCNVWAGPKTPSYQQCREISFNPN